MMNPNQSQTLENHRQIVPLVHYFMLPVGTLASIGGIVQAIRAIISGDSLLSSILLLILGILVFLQTIVARSSALRLQDRLIRTEEELRYFKLTGKWLDGRLNIKQLIALRFASDAEFAALSERASKENMAPPDIKKAIKQWRADFFRV
jgi:hypothetical protein